MKRSSGSPESDLRLNGRSNETSLSNRSGKMEHCRIRCVSSRRPLRRCAAALVNELVEAKHQLQLS